MQGMPGMMPGMTGMMPGMMQGMQGMPGMTGMMPPGMMPGGVMPGMQPPPDPASKDSRTYLHKCSVCTFDVDRKKITCSMLIAKASEAAARQAKSQHESKITQQMKLGVAPESRVHQSAGFKYWVDSEGDPGGFAYCMARPVHPAERTGTKPKKEGKAEGADVEAVPAGDGAAVTAEAVPAAAAAGAAAAAAAGSSFTPQCELLDHQLPGCRRRYRSTVRPSTPNPSPAVYSHGGRCL